MSRSSSSRLLSAAARPTRSSRSITSFVAAPPLDRLPQIADILREAGIDAVPTARVAVLVGTALNPTKERRPPNLQGIVIRTLWGEIGAQLAEQAGNTKLYDHVRDADRKGVPPGSDAFRALFDECGPCLILIDELVAYARKIYGVEGLPSGAFDAVQTFIQELTEGVRASKNTVLVATIPESDIEIGGEAGQATLSRIEHTFGRMEAIWKPVGSEEGFEVVRRRLFLPLEDEPARDDVCRAFSTLYRDGASEFPSECREVPYLDRMKACYPIHPEVFDRLYADWSTLERFQRTRGVLRLMAAVIHDLWVRNDASLLIMPGSLGLDAPSVRDELTRYLPEGWTSVLESDVDGRNSGPLARRCGEPAVRPGDGRPARRKDHISRERPSRRAAAGTRGRGRPRVRLAAVQPGEQVSVFNDALSQLSDRLTYLYRQDRRYWYDTRPNLRRTVEERAQQYSEDKVEREIERRVREAVRRDRGDFKGVHACPTSSGDVPDDQEVRLVVIPPTATHKGNGRPSEALNTASDILANRGTAPRQHRNTLVFLAADQNAMEGPDGGDAPVPCLAIRGPRPRGAEPRCSPAPGSCGGREDEQPERGGTVQRGMAMAACAHADGRERERGGPRMGDLPGYRERRLLSSRRLSQRVRTSEHLIARWSPALLKMELDRWFWKDREHVSVKAVWDALSAYCYLPRLRDQAVFVEAVQDGVRSGDYFGYATSVSSEGRYEGLTLASPAAAIYVDAPSVLVKPDVARRQLEAERPEPPTPVPGPRPGSRSRSVAGPRPRASSPAAASSPVLRHHRDRSGSGGAGHGAGRLKRSSST